MKALRYLCLALALVGLGSPALAGSGTFAATPCSAGCTTYQTTTNGGGNSLGQFSLWDYSAGANGLAIGSDHNFTVDQGAAAASGPWIATPWIAGAVNAVGNPLFFSPGTGATFVLGTGTGNIGNLLQGGSVLSATNGLFVAPTTAATWGVSGTVTANAGTNLNTSALATSANQTNASQKTQVVDGSGNVIASTANALNTYISGGGITGFANAAAFTGSNGVVGAGLSGTNVAIPQVDPCAGNAQTTTPISMTSATTTKIATGVSAKKIYVCSLTLFTAIANNVAVIEGTTATTCGTSAAGVIGGATAANGFNFAANQGFVMNGGTQHVAATATANDDLCLITSAAGPLAGVLVWVTQ